MCMLNAQESVGNVWKYDIKNGGVRRTWVYCPHVMLLLYFIADCSVQFKINWFAHDAQYGIFSFLCEL